MIPSLGWWWCPQRLKGTQPKVRTPCLSSPEFLSECVRMLRSAPGKGKTDVASPYRQYGVPFYPLAESSPSPRAASKPNRVTTLVALLSRGLPRLCAGAVWLAESTQRGVWHAVSVLE